MVKRRDTTIRYYDISINCEKETSWENIRTQTLPERPQRGRRKDSIKIPYRNQGSSIADPEFLSWIWIIPGSGSTSASKILIILTQRIASKLSEIWSGCSSRIQILIFYSSRIPDPGVKKAPDTGSTTPQVTELKRGRAPGENLLPLVHGDALLELPQHLHVEGDQLLGWISRRLQHVLR